MEESFDGEAASDTDLEASAQSSLRESIDDRHWVEELFPPAFGFTVDEILADIGKKEEKELSVFEKYAQRIHPLDTSAIRNVYERVWLMSTVEKEEQENTRLEQEKVGKLRESKLLEKGHDIREVRDADTSTTELENLPKYDIHDSCIWTDSEIDVLREVFQTARKQNRELEAKLAETTDRLSVLEGKHKKQRKLLDDRTVKLNEATKANGRLNLLAQNLNEQLKKAVSEVEFLKEEIETLKEQRTEYMQEAHNNKVEYNKERIERKNVAFDLQRQTKDALHEQMIREEKMKMSHEQSIVILQRKLSEVTQELEDERKAHDRTKKGLDHLRTHFSSLPFSGEADNSGMVVEDQLKKWTY